MGFLKEETTIGLCNLVKYTETQKSFLFAKIARRDFSQILLFFPLVENHSTKITKICNIHISI